MAVLPKAPIGTIPRGLLDLLNLKQMGVNPSVLVDTVQPIVDMRDFWFNQLEQDQLGLFNGVQPVTNALPTGSIGITAFNVTVGQAQVPANEVWFIRGITCGIFQTTFAAAADSIRAGVLMAPAGGAGGTLITPATQDNVSARARLWMTEPMPQPVWAPPGTLFWMAIFDMVLAAGTRQFYLDMRAVRMRI